MSMMNDLTAEHIEYLLQFSPPEKSLAPLPGVSDAAMAGLFGLPLDTYREVRGRFALD